MASWFSNILKRAARIGSKHPGDPGLIALFGGGDNTWAGEYVTESSALQIQAVYACVRVLSESLASMPLKVYRRTPGGGKEVAAEHPIYSLVHDAPNPEQTAFEFWEMAMGHCATWGNFYAQLRMDGKDVVREMWPLRPDLMQVERADSGERVYRYRKGNSDRVFLEREILHVPGLGFDGLVGYSPIALQRETLGAAVGTSKFAAKLFANGAKPSGILQIPTSIKGDAAKNLRESFGEAYQGAGNAHKVITLEEGVKFIQTTIPPNDAQFLETRKYQRSEIAGIFRVPPHMIADLERATFSNIEHQDLSFAKHTMAPWCKRFEMRATKALMGPREASTYFCEFDMRALMRGDAASRAAFYTAMVNMGSMSPNEVRAAENMNPVAAGDVFFRPLNTAFVDSAGRITGPVDPAAQGGNANAGA